jgi:hypothetical protein
MSAEGSWIMATQISEFFLPLLALVLVLIGSRALSRRSRKL